MKAYLLKNQNYIKVFGMVLIIRISFFFVNTTYWFNSDRIGDLLAPTALAGLDWSNLIPHVRYYGYGFKWIYAIFFRLTDDPTIIYYSIMIMYNILFALIGVLIYHLLTRYLKMNNLKLAGLIAVFMGIVEPADMKSEPSLVIVSWIACFLLMKAIYKTSKKDKILYAIWIALFLSYTLTLHERMLAIVLAFLFIFIIYRVKFNEWIVNPWVYYPVQIVSYFGVQSLNDMYRNYFWGTTVVANSSALPTTLNADYLTSFYGIKVAVACIWSNLVTLGTQTYGLAWIAVAIFVGSFLFVWQKKNKITKQHGEDSLISEDYRTIKYETVDKAIYTTIWVFGICVAIVMVGLAERWGKSVFNGNLYGYKGFVYGRYYVNFAYPAIAAAIAFIVSHKIKKRDIIITGSSLLLLVGVFVKWIYPILDSAYYTYVATETTSSTMLEWLLFATIFKGESIHFNLYVNLLIIAVLLVLISVAVLRKKYIQNYVISILVIIGLVLFVETNGFTYARPTVSFSDGIYDETYNFIQDIEDKGINLKEQLIYTDHTPWALQYMLNRYKISYDWPIVNDVDTAETEDVILITCFTPEQEISNFGDDDVFYISLQDREYVYFTDVSLAEQLQGVGYNVIKLKEASNDNDETTKLIISEKTIPITGIENEYKIVVVNDLHIIVPNDEVSEEYMGIVTERHENMFVDNIGTPSSENWLAMAEEIDALDADLVVFAGDMMDYASTTNFECLQEGMSIIDAPILYIRSDHDYSRHYTGDALTRDEVVQMHSEIDGDPDIWNVDMDEFAVVGINKSWESISEQALTQVEEAMSQDSPIILVTHVPYDSLIDKELRLESYRNREIYNLWGLGNRYVPDENMVSLLENVYAEDTSVEAVFAGHLHFTYDAYLTENVMEYVFAPSYNGNVGIINVVPDVKE